MYKRQRITATLIHADGSEDCALDIPDWDFHWQESYRYAAGDSVQVASGDAVEVTCTYDNTAQHQLALPDGVVPAPRDVTWGEGTRDEMCIFYYTSIAPFSATPPEPPTPCAPASACIAACARADGPSLACVLGCVEASTACQLCSVRASLRCSQFACLGTLTDATDCLVTCLEASIMLGTNLGQCLDAECPAAYATALACLDAPIDTSECRAELAPCGVDFRE